MMPQSILLSSANFTYNNPFWEVYHIFGQDLHYGCFYRQLYGMVMRSSCLQLLCRARGGGCYGVRLGLDNINQSSYLDVTSPPNIGQECSCILDDEGCWRLFPSFQKAKLRWDLGSETAKSLWARHHIVFDEAGVSGAASYISNSTSVPADFADKSGNA